MRSLKSLFIPAEGDELASALIQGTSLVLEALALHAIRIDDREHREFQTTIRGHAREMAKAGITAPEIMVLSGAAIHAVEAYSRETERQIRAQSNDLRAIASMLISALADSYHDNPRAVAGLQYIERQLEKALQLEDLRSLRQKLAECLTALRRKAPSLRFASEWPADPGEGRTWAAAGKGAGGGSYSDGPSSSEQPPSSERPSNSERPSSSELRAHRRSSDESIGAGSGKGDEDGITGLPGRYSAEGAIHRAIHGQAIHGEGYWAAVPVVVDRIEAVNARFGSKTGDELLLAMVQTLAQKFGQKDELFRWQGPCFVALIERDGNMSAIQAEMNRLLNPRVNHTAAAAGRTILMPVSFSWTVVPLWDGSSVGAVSEKINDFLVKRRAGM